MAANTLKRGHDLEGWELLKEELLELAGDDTQPEDKGAHDDLAIATGLAAWTAANDFPELLPEVEDESFWNRRGPLF